MNSIRDNLLQPLSHLARDKQGEIAGISIVRIFDRPSPEDKDDAFGEREKMPLKCRYIVDLADALENEVGTVKETGPKIQIFHAK